MRIIIGPIAIITVPILFMAVYDDYKVYKRRKRSYELEQKYN
jgi:hypothetical protein